MCDPDEFLTIKQLCEQWPISNNSDDIWRGWVNAWMQDGSLNQAYDFKYNAEGTKIIRTYRVRSLLRLLYKDSRINGIPNMKKKFVCDHYEDFKQALSLPDLSPTV